MINFDQLYKQHSASWEDFWDRRAHEPKFSAARSLLGTTDYVFQQPSGCAGCCRSRALPLYSSVADDEQPPFSVQLVVRDNPFPPGPLPDNLFDSMQYSGDADWLMIKLGEFGHCHVDLSAGRAVAVLAPELAMHPTSRQFVLAQHGHHQFLHRPWLRHAPRLMSDARPTGVNADGPA